MTWRAFVVFLILGWPLHQWVQVSAGWEATWWSWPGALFTGALYGLVAIVAFVDRKTR